MLRNYPADTRQRWLTSTTCTMASSSGAVKSPNRVMPLRSPSACDSAVPSARAISSLVWWSSIQVSPSASTSTSKRPCDASCCVSQGPIELHFLIWMPS